MQFRLFELAAQVDRNHAASRRNRDILEHRLAPMPEFGRMDRGNLEVVLLAARQQLHNHRRRHFLGDDQQGPAALFNQRDHAGELFAGLNLVIRHQDERIVENDLHFLHIGDHVM